MLGLAYPVSGLGQPLADETAGQCIVVDNKNVIHRFTSMTVHGELKRLEYSRAALM
jgi:hypothetical protein